MPDKMSKRMPDKMSERLSEDMSERMSEDTSERMSLQVYKKWFRVGATHRCWETNLIVACGPANWKSERIDSGLSHATEAAE